MREKLQTLPLAQLKELAKSQGIRGLSSMKKSEIIDLLCQKAQEQEKPDPDADYLDGEEEMDFDLPDDFEDEEDDSTMYDAEDNEPV